jgi:cytochrome c oxidase subunit 1
MAYSMIAIAFLSWVVWGHHMFQSGMNPALGMAFMTTTMVIAVPSAIKVFNWLGTLWGGNIKFDSPMLYSLAFVSMFVIGGLSGIFMAATPVDIFIHDTYFIVGHIHYVVFGGSIFAIFAEITYWFPKMFGRMMKEQLAKIHFFGTFIFFNWKFFQMHIIGMGGHMRRIYNLTQYEFLQLQHWNVFMTIGALCLGAFQLVFAFNFQTACFRSQGGAQPVARQHARLGGTDAGAARQLPAHPARVPWTLRVQRARREGRLPAAGAARACRSRALS